MRASRRRTREHTNLLTATPERPDRLHDAHAAFLLAASAALQESRERETRSVPEGGGEGAEDAGTEALATQARVLMDKVRGRPGGWMDEWTLAWLEASILAWTSLRV